MKKEEIEITGKDLAQKRRRLLGLSDSEPVALESLLNTERIIALFRPLNDDLPGMSIRIDDKKFMLINSEHPAGRQNFSICHEIYHLYDDSSPKSHLTSSKAISKSGYNEEIADVFASHFLIPESGIENTIPVSEKLSKKIGVETVLILEQKFQCSRQAILNRLYKLKYISTDQKEAYSRDVKTSAQKYGFPLHLYEPRQTNIIGDYKAKADELYINNKISESFYHELLSDLELNHDFDEFSN
jgi:Zn-dependent peptidase ImmA (M78 family)